jgi:hypothetical protein
MSIRDIIKAATPGPWRIATSKSVKVGDRTICRTHDRKWRYGNDEQETNDARFIAAFDPEHVALMEAVCEAVGRCGSGLVMDAPHEWRTVAEAYDDLQAYRKERGL